MNALKKLSDLDREHRIRKCPAMPPQYIIGTKFTDKTANGLTKAIISFLTFEGWQAERISSMGRKVGKITVVRTVTGFSQRIGSEKYIPGTSTNGTADISSTIKGRSIKIEVKINKDRQSDAQKAYQLSIEKSGGIYYIAKDFEAFHAWYQDLLTQL